MDESHESISGEFAGVLEICSHGREKYFWIRGDFKRPVISGGGGVRLMVGSPEGLPLITIFIVPPSFDFARVYEAPSLSRKPVNT